MSSDSSSDTPLSPIAETDAISETKARDDEILISAVMTLRRGAQWQQASAGTRIVPDALDSLRTFRMPSSCTDWGSRSPR